MSRINMKLYSIYLEDWEEYRPVSHYSTLRRAQNALERLLLDMKDKEGKAHYYYRSNTFEIVESVIDEDTWESGEVDTTW